MRPALLLYNPAAGGARAGQAAGAVTGALVTALAETGWEATPEPTRGPGTAAEQARRAAGDGAEAVFALGGDGTLREAAAGLLGSRVPVGFLPAGTTNVMARELGLPRRALAAARAMAGAREIEMDVGLANGEPFLMQVSAGIDALAIARLDPRWKRLLGQGAIVPAGLPAWWRYGYPPIAVTAGGERYEGSFAVVTNIAFYGGPWKIAPAASARDRRLDLVIFSGRGRRATLGLARDVFLGRHLRRPDVRVEPVDRALLEGPADLPLQLDGDRLLQSPPVEITLSPDRLRVLAR